MEDKKNMTPEEMDNQEEMTVTLTLDDGKELKLDHMLCFFEKVHNRY